MTGKNNSFVLLLRSFMTVDRDIDSMDEVCRVVEAVQVTAKRVKEEGIEVEGIESEYPPVALFIDGRKVSFVQLEWEDNRDKEMMMDAIRQLAASEAFNNLVGIILIADTRTVTLPPAKECGMSDEELEQLIKTNRPAALKLGKKEECIFIIAETYYGDSCWSLYYEIKNGRVEWGRVVDAKGLQGMRGRMTNLLPPKPATAQA